MKRNLFCAVLLMALLLVLPAFAAEQISFDQQSVSLYENETLFLPLQVSEGLQGGEVRYSTGNKSIVTVDNSGLITAVSKGSAVITASLKTAKQTYKATVKVKGFAGAAKAIDEDDALPPDENAVELQPAETVG